MWKWCCPGLPAALRVPQALRLPWAAARFFLHTSCDSIGICCYLPWHLTRGECLGSLCNKRNINGIHLLLSLLTELIWGIAQGFFFLSVPLQALESLDCKNPFIFFFCFWKTVKLWLKWLKQKAETISGAENYGEFVGPMALEKKRKYTTEKAQTEACVLIVLCFTLSRCPAAAAQLLQDDHPCFGNCM